MRPRRVAVGKVQGSRAAIAGVGQCDSKRFHGVRIDRPRPLGRGRLRVAGPAAMLGLPRLLRDLGMREVPHPWHLLRHTFGSHFVMAGGNILALQKILGHSDVKMTLIYAHLAPDFLGQEMERITYER